MSGAGAGPVDQPWRLRAGYAAGSVATGAFGTVPGLLLLPLLTDELGVAALVAGLVVLLPKAWDVVLNPVAGRVSDRTRDPRGPRRPWLLRAGVALAAAFALMFAVPDLGAGTGATVAQTAWVLVAFTLAASAYAFFQVPYVAMPAEMTAGRADAVSERGRMMTWRVAVLALTILVVGGSAPAVRDAVGGRAGYAVMGAVVAVVILLGALAAYAGTRSAPVRTVPAGEGSLRDQLRVVAGAPDFRRLLATFVVQALATGAMLAGVDYLADDVLERDGAATLLFVCFVAPALLLTGAWTALGRRIGKRRGWVVASLVLAAGAAGCATAAVAPLAVVLAAVAVVGVGYAGCQAYPLAMLPDAVADDARRTGTDRAGVFTGVWTAGETLGLALGPGLVAVQLALGGYRSSAGLDVDQPASAVTAIVLAFSVAPAALVVASLLPLRRYALADRDPVTATP